MVEQSRPLQLAQDADDADLREQLAEREEEILRLRDLLITRDAELGAAKGRLTMIEQGSQRLSEAAARIPIPGATRLIHMMIRFVQRSLR
jgi:predicted nuclease with TOPRIM domain